MKLADMLVQGEPPAKFAKALAVIADRLHPLFNAEPWIARHDKSKESCVLASLAVRDFLRKIGFKGTEVRPVVFFVNATDAKGEQIHSLGCGYPDMEEVRRQTGVKSNGWPGHLVVSVPSTGYMVDTTLYQANRDAWPDLPGMIAAKLVPATEDDRFWGLLPLTGIAATREDGGRLDLLWLDQPENKLWRDAGDARYRERRSNVVKQMVAAFGRWTD